MKTIFHRMSKSCGISLTLSSAVDRILSGSATRIRARYLLKSPLELSCKEGGFKALKMNAWEDERRIAKIDNTRAQYQHAGPIQNPSEIGCQEKHPMTAAARIVPYQRRQIEAQRQRQSIETHGDLYEL